ncbi:MAG: PQQ-binding-like beta-propeller repeat protein [Mariprofundus sp.]|nr:PQQ-binding-like beta-propeller repeat protein [Mariprofundus sp.]
MMISACSTVSGLWSSSPPRQAAIKPVAHIPSSTGHISVLWRNNLDQRKPASPPGFSLPAAIATAQGELVVAGAQDKRVRIYRANGSEMARIALANASESGALKLSNGLVVIGDVGGNLYALDIGKARIAWQKQLSSALIGTPVATDEGFIIQTSNNQIYHFTVDGKKLWSYSGQLGGLGIHLNPSPVIYKDRVYAIFSNGDVIALKVKNGNFMWKRQMLLSNKAPVMSEIKIPAASPLVIPAAGHTEAMLLVSIFQGELSFISLQDGSTLSRRKLSLKSKPLLIGNTVFTADASGALSALNAAGGETLWKQQLSHGELTGPVLWHGSLWVADDQARIFRLDQSGTLLASTQLNGRIDRTPVAAKSGILVRNNLGTLYMLR